MLLLLAMAVLVPIGLAALERGGPEPVTPEAAPPSGPAPRGAAAPGPDTVPYDPATAPQEFRERPASRPCGSYVLGQGERVAQAAYDCLLRAREARAAAELAVSRLTVEGQPVVTYTRVTEQAGLETWTDSTGDDYGFAGWTRQRCASTDDRLRPQRCGAVEPFPTAPAAGGGPCPDGPTALADYVDFVRVGERDYHRAGEAPVGTELGSPFLTVRCELSEGAPDAGYDIRSGDAAYLPAGTELRRVEGFDPRFRLAAEVDGQVRLYEAAAPALPGVGADVFPGVRPHVRALLLLSQQDGRTELARIADPARVAELADALFGAPYRPVRSFDGDLFLGLLLDDGTVVARAYDSSSGVLHPGIALPRGFQQAVEAAR